MPLDPLAREPVPVGYRVRLAISHHLGGWAPCGGTPQCEHCGGLERKRKSLARRRARERLTAGRQHPDSVVAGRVVAGGADASA